MLAYWTLALGPPGQIWALVDSNPRIPVPAAAFQSQIFFVVEAVPFSPLHLEWTDSFTARRFFMKTWTFLEVLQAYVETPLYITNTHISCSRPFLSSGTEHQLWHLYNEYRASPRVLTDFTCNPLTYKEIVVKEVLSVDPAALHNVPQSLYLIDSPHLMLMDPLPTARFKLEKRVASRCIAEMLQAKRSKLKSPYAATPSILLCASSPEHSLHIPVSVLGVVPQTRA